MALKNDLSFGDIIASQTIYQREQESRRDDSSRMQLVITVYESSSYFIGQEDEKNGASIENIFIATF